MNIKEFLEMLNLIIKRTFYLSELLYEKIFVSFFCYFFLPELNK